jgi:hypothetical protein
MCTHVHGRMHISPPGRVGLKIENPTSHAWACELMRTCVRGPASASCHVCVCVRDRER